MISLSTIFFQVRIASSRTLRPPRRQASRNRNKRITGLLLVYLGGVWRRLTLATADAASRRPFATDRIRRTVGMAFAFPLATLWHRGAVTQSHRRARKDPRHG